MKIFKRKHLVHYLPIVGCVATGITYVGIGVIALLSFFQIRDGGADESSMLVVLNDFLLGKILIVIILTGTACYIVWRFYEAFNDPYQYGSDFKGVAKRVGIALSTVADMLIVYAAVRVLLGTANISANGQPVEERAMTKAMLDDGKGWIIITIGCVMLATAFIQLLYGGTKGYKERVNDHYLNPALRKVFHGLGLTGYAARGIILAITGFFFLKAGISNDANVVVNTDKAFDFVGDHIGHIFFILLAVGTICYGFFMFGLGITYKAGKQPRRR